MAEFYPGQRVRVTRDCKDRNCVYPSGVGYLKPGDEIVLIRRSTEDNWGGGSWTYEPSAYYVGLDSIEELVYQPGDILAELLG